MNPFRKKEKLVDVVSDEECIVYDFVLRAPFWGYRPISYREYEPFINFQNEIDGFLDKLFSKEDSIDVGNKNVLDDLIVDMAKQAEEDLKKQKAVHVDHINKFDHRRKGDRLSFENQIKLLEEALMRNEKTHKEVDERFIKNKFRKGDTKNNA